MRWLARLLVVLAAVVTARSALAHPAVRCAAMLKVNADGRGTLTLRFDVPAFVLNEEPFKIADEPMWAFVDGPASEVERLLRDGAGRLQRHVRVQTDGADVPIVLRSFPTLADFERWKSDIRTPDEKPRLPWMAEAVIEFDVVPSSKTPTPNPLPRGGGSGVTVRLPEVLGDIVLAVEVPGAEAQAMVLKPGEQSPEFQWRRAAISTAESGEEQQVAHGFVSFVRMGIEHIVPHGLDHMLFILGLYLASPGIRSLLILVTTFTLAHSVTLALAATGLVVAPPRVIEPLIALSIAAVAVENVWRARGKKASRGASAAALSDSHPPTPSLGEGASEKGIARLEWVRAGIVFAFGLVHGLGFASAFEEMELPRSVLVPALVGFNVGVEVGQLLVLCGAFVLIGWAAKKTWYRKGVVIPGSIAIACVGLYWAVTRVWAG